MTAPSMTSALVELRGVARLYSEGEQQIYALRAIDLDIHAGEMVALMGASGSGKSTLMNILGCLDRPSEGTYRIAGANVAALDADALAALRRAHFGFVFQRYNLLPQLSALANVEIPAIYAGHEARERRARAGALLERLGLGHRLDHRPSKLSGGQQQRVSIARALMNGGEIILADEPTGALDSRTGREVMELLTEINRRGHTLIIATHDHAVASCTHRIVELADGRIVSDRPTERAAESAATKAEAAATEAASDAPKSDAAKSAGGWARFAEAAHMAVVALLSHRLRTALTLLGIVIGIVSVVTMVALGEAAQRVLEEDLKGMTTNTIEIYPGKDWGDPDQTRIQTLTIHDVEALRRQDYVEDASPLTSQSALLRYRAVGGTATVNGVGVGYFEMIGLPVAQGGAFTRKDVERQTQVVVIDENVKRRFFGGADPLGATLYVGKLPCIVIGVTGRNYQQEARGGSKLSVWLPYTTAATRIVGRGHLDTIIVALRPGEAPKAAEDRMEPFMTKLHKVKDFMIFNLAERIRAGVVMFRTMSLLLAAIGVISLTVGGVGVMNIMLVSVAERAREIGVRVAVGARQADIRRQFLIESVLVCLLGAALGVALSFVVCATATYFLPPEWKVWLSFSAILAAVASATVTGVVFGYAPARNAARLDPVEALARD